MRDSPASVLAPLRASLELSGAPSSTLTELAVKSIPFTVTRESPLLVTTPRRPILWTDAKPLGEGGFGGYSSTVEIDVITPWRVDAIVEAYTYTNLGADLSS